ncbi:WYL domain-containing protein [soil metagenome]
MTAESGTLAVVSGPASRMLRLLSILQAQHWMSGPDLAARLEVSPRTLRRDVDRLRGLGYPVHATTGAGGGYRLQAGTAMPPLLLDDEEAVAIAVGLRTAAGGTVAGMEESSLRALAKLEQVLPSRLRRRVNALQTYTVPLSASGPTVNADVLVAIVHACRDDEGLRFDYRSRDGIESGRHVEPHRLVSANQRWYLVAWDVDRDDWRTFRVDRLDRPRLTGFRFDPHRLPAADAAAFVAHAIASIPSRHQVVVTLHAPLEVMAERWCLRTEMLEVLDERTCRLRTGADSLEWFALTLGMLGVDFDVHEPAELIDHVGALAGRFHRSTAVETRPMA